MKLTVWSSHENILDTIEKAFSFAELHQKLLEHTRRFFTDIHNTVQENSTIFLIKDYISRNYGNENLSVKEISSHVFLSTSYICTFFKNETGQTLNQYLTEYRMEQAKRLLSDPRYKITEISSRVGYSDGKVEGFSFRVTGANGYEQVFTTDKNGEIFVEGLRIGDYTISEISDSVSQNYVLPADKKATVFEGAVTKVEMHNELRDTPKTGDDSNPTLWIALMGIAAVGAVTCGVFGIKNKKKKEDAE